MEESMQSNEREIRLGAGLVEEGVNVFLLPCKIDLDGSAPFSKYFNIKEIDEGEDRDTGGKKAITASFRGRKLLGEKYILPSNTHGAIVTELSSGTTHPMLCVCSFRMGVCIIFCRHILY
eukprot:477236_1